MRQGLIDFTMVGNIHVPLKLFFLVVFVGAATAWPGNLKPIFEFRAFWESMGNYRYGYTDKAVSPNVVVDGNLSCVLCCLKRKSAVTFFGEENNKYCFMGNCTKWYFSGKTVMRDGCFAHVCLSGNNMKTEQFVYKNTDIKFEDVAQNRKDV